MQPLTKFAIFGYEGFWGIVEASSANQACDNVRTTAAERNINPELLGTLEAFPATPEQIAEHES